MDPPPVVELRIWEGKDGEQKEDITFGYGANFFLFATLEVARPMAHGRVQQTSAPQIPVLTGMPVSGMAYLDRPSEAGYFIFPDLSVRHEGIYLLSFNLYEETKDKEDRDAETQDSKPKGPAAADSSFDWRLEIKSDKFTVYSAKKFPGLAESTSISRTVAEQGCRVRIRRDVRMRRREGKSSGDMEIQEDEYSRAGRPLEQDYETARSRSHSNGSGDARAPYQESFRSGSGSPIAPHVPVPPGGVLAQFDHHRADGQFSAPSSFHPPQAPQQPPYRPAENSYQPPTAQQYEQRYSQPQPNYSSYGRQLPASAVEAPREPMYEQPQWRRASEAGYQPHHPQHHGSFTPAVDANYSRPPPIPAYAPRSPIVARLPPLRLGERHEGVQSPPGPLSSLAQYAHPLPSPSYDRSHERSASYSQYPAPPLLAPAPIAASGPEETPRAGAKRAYDAVFSSSATTKPLHNGMRPGTSHGGAAVFDEDEDSETMDIANMIYKRADGSDFHRTLPCL